MPIFAISLIAILALVGATIALGMDTRSGNKLQHSADSAALGGATAFLNHKSPRAEDRLKAAQIQARELASRNSEYALVDLVIDALTEDAYGQHTEIEVELEAQPVNFFSRFTGENTTADMRRRAVAAATWGFPLCLLSLSEARDTGFAIKHRADFAAKGCIVWSNSDYHRSMDFKGGKSKAKYFCTAGQYKRNMQADVSPQPTEGCEPIPDPMAKWRPPVEGMCEPDPDFQPPASIIRAVERLTKKKNKGNSYGHEKNCEAGKEKAYCNQPDHEGTGEGLLDFDQLALTDNLDSLLYSLDRQHDRPTDTLSPGTYCGLDINYGHVMMEPGTYFIKDAPMTITRKATVTAEGVTIIFTGPNAYLRVSDAARLDLKAPKHGPLAGIAIAERRNTSVNGKPVVTRLTGAGAMSIIGLIYIPTQNFFISGAGAGDQSSPLLQIVANRIAMRDIGKLKIDFKPGKTDVPMVIQPERHARLVE